MSFSNRNSSSLHSFEDNQATRSHNRRLSRKPVNYERSRNQSHSKFADKNDDKLDISVLETPPIIEAISTIKPALFNPSISMMSITKLKFGMKRILNNSVSYSRRKLGELPREAPSPSQLNLKSFRSGDMNTQSNLSLSISSTPDDTLLRQLSSQIDRLQIERDVARNQLSFLTTQKFAEMDIDDIPHLLVSIKVILQEVGADLQNPENEGLHDDNLTRYTEAARLSESILLKVENLISNPRNMRSEISNETLVIGVNTSNEYDGNKSKPHELTLKESTSDQTISTSEVLLGEMVSPYPQKHCTGEPTKFQKFLNKITASTQSIAKDDTQDNTKYMQTNCSLNKHNKLIERRATLFATSTLEIGRKKIVAKHMEPLDIVSIQKKYSIDEFSQRRIPMKFEKSQRSIARKAVGELAV